MRRLSSAATACAVALSIVSAAGPTSAAVAPKERADRTWMVDGKVFALARHAGRLYIGGRFTQLQPPRGSGAAPMPAHNLAAIDLASGEPVRSWRPDVGGADATVHALAIEGGAVYVGGRFASLGGSPVANLGAVTLAGGDAIGGFAPAVSGRVYALLASPDRLYAGGAFGRVDGLSRAKLAAWNLPSRSLTQAWKPRALGGAVRDLAFDAGHGAVFIAGAFDAMAQGGSTFTRESVAKVDAATGSLSSWQIPVGQVGSPQTGWDVSATASRLHGGFGRGPNFAASFDATGNVGTRIWRFGVVGNVQAVELSPGGSRLYLGGHFGLGRLQQQICGKNLRGLISVDPATGAPFCDWIPQLAPFGGNFNGPWALEAVGQRLWVGGGWGKVDGLRQRNLARFTVPEAT
jgi:hypothetical protein